MEDIQSHNWIEFGYRWFNLPDYRELYHDVERICETRICPVNGLREYNREGLQYIFFENENHPKYKKPLQEAFIPNSEYKENYIVPNVDLWNDWIKSRQATSWSV